MFFYALSLIAVCLCETFFAPIGANAEDESIVYVKQGALDAECPATYENPCPTIALAKAKLGNEKAKFVIKILKGTADLVWSSMEMAETGKTYLIQGTKTATEDEIVTVEFPSTLSSHGLVYKSETELKNLKFLCPAGLDDENIWLISPDASAVGITLNTVTFERKDATSGGTHTYILMELRGKVTINNVVITSADPWTVKSGLSLVTEATCTVKNLKITNVTVPESTLSVVSIATVKDVTIEDSSFTNCKAEKSAYSGALLISCTSEDAVITFKTTTFKGCIASSGLAGALFVRNAKTEAKVMFTGADALAFTDCSIGTGDKKVVTAAFFSFSNTTASLENLAKKIKDSFGKNYYNLNHKNLILGRIGDEGEKVDLSQFWPDPPTDDPSKDAAFGMKIDFILFFAALASVFAALL